MNKIIIAYGFEYDTYIYYKSNAIICRTIENDKQFYACSLFFKEYNINKISDKIKELENKNKHIFNNIDILARTKGLTANWKLVFYDDKIDEIRV